MQGSLSYEFSDLPVAACTGCHEEYDSGNKLMPAFGQAYVCPLCQAVSYVHEVAITHRGAFNVMFASRPKKTKAAAC